MMPDGRIPSPTDDKRGCLCKNGTYSRKCCKGKLENQGIGALEGGGTSVKNQIDTTRTN